MTHTIEGRSINLPAGRTLYRQGEEASHAFVIHSGVVKLYTDRFTGNISGLYKNAQRLSDLASPGDIIGLHHHEHPHTAITASDTHVTIAEPRHLLKHGAGDLLLRFIAHHNQRTAARFQQQEYPVPIRLGELLSLLAERFPDPSDPQRSQDLPLTLDELADLMHASRPTISRYSNELSTYNALKKHRGSYRIHAAGVHAFLDHHSAHATV